MRTIGAVLLLLTLAARVMAQPLPPHDAPGVTAVELLSPTMFPGASMGMVVEDAKDGVVASVRTLGADFVIDKNADTIECRQRIAAQRPVAKIKLPAGSLAGIALSHESEGAAIFTGKSTVRINGDSLLMISAGVDGAITAELLFTPDYFSQHLGNFNFFDPVGGIAFFEHGQQPRTSTQLARDPCTVTWQWKAGDVFWAGVSPPKAFDWNRSVEDRQVVYGSSYPRYIYPDALALARWSKLGRTLFFHCENAWVNWQTDLTPRDTESHFRLIRTASEYGMKVAFYTSPKAFLKGTVIEDRATPDVNDPKATGWPTGSNVKEFLRQAERLVREFEVSGLYFDEMYCKPSSLAASYFLARSCRELLGDSNSLNYHCTEDVLGDRQEGELFGRTNCPAVHAYFDVLYKGEGVWDRFDPAYLRYVLGTYNISNTVVGPNMNNGAGGLTLDRVDRYLRGANARFFVMEHEAYTGAMDVFRNVYLYRLTPQLQRQIEPDLLRPTGVFEQYRKTIEAP